jgi:hypothetical protein
MGPKIEDQLSDLTALVGQFITATGAAIEKTNKKVEELTDAVDTLTDQLKDEATRQTTSSARVDKQVRQTADAIDKLASSKTGGKATKATVSLLRPQDPPELTTTRMGTNHYDWLQQSLAAIRFWNPDAARLLTDKSLSITDDGVFYLDPAHSHINEAVYALLDKAVAGKARSHLHERMRAYADDDDLQGEPDWLSDHSADHDGNGRPAMARTARWSEQQEFLSRSAFLAWEALSQLNEDDATKWLDSLQARTCAQLDGVSSHLDKMSELYDKYSGCIHPDQLATEQPMLSRTLAHSLPDSFLTQINASFRGKKRKARTWSKTMRIAREILTEQIEISGRRASRKALPAPPKPTRRPNDARPARPNKPQAQPKQISYAVDEMPSAHAAAPTRKYTHDGFCPVCGKYGHRGEHCRADCDRPECGGLFKYPKHAPNCPRNTSNQQRPKDAARPGSSTQRAYRADECSDSDDEFADAQRAEA